MKVEKEIKKISPLKTHGETCLCGRCKKVRSKKENIFNQLKLKEEEDKKIISDFVESLASLNKTIVEFHPIVFSEIISKFDRLKILYSENDPEKIGNKLVNESVRMYLEKI